MTVPVVSPPKPIVVSKTAAAAHDESIIVNLLDATILPRHLPGFPIQSYLDDLRRGGVTVFVTCVAAHHEDGFAEACVRMIRWHRLVESVAPALGVILRPSDILRVNDNRGLGVLFQFQDPKPVEDDLLKLEAFYRLGLRILQLTYQRRNLAADGCGERHDGGVSNFGRELIIECNRLGILVDLAHGGHKTILDAIEISEVPLMISHTAAYALCPHPRNIRDDHMRAIAETNGLIGIHGLAYLLRTDGGPKGASIDDLVAHIDYIVDRAGIDHVGIGTDVGTIVAPSEVPKRAKAWETLGKEFPELFVADFDFSKRYVRGLDASSGLPRLTEALISRGYSVADVEKVLGGNFLRVFGEVERARKCEV